MIGLEHMGHAPIGEVGRRQTRDLILRLKNRGCTVFFSSHILSDAEALCSRVAIMAQGRLVASGSLSDIVQLELKGWEIVAASVPEATIAAMRARARSVTMLAEGRYMIQLAPDGVPEQVVVELVRAGAHIVSLLPERETLEDYFIRAVKSALPRQTGIA